MTRCRALRHLLGDDRAVAALEFALVLPVLILFGLGIAEVGRATLLDLKVGHAATTVADLAARDETLTTAGLDDLLLAAGQIVRPFTFGASAVVIVSAVGKDAGTARRIVWQRKGGGTLAASSGIGAAGGAATLPTTMTMLDGETVIVAEVYYRYSGWLLALIPSFTMRHVAFYRPRLGTLRALG